MSTDSWAATLPMGLDSSLRFDGSAATAGSLNYQLQKRQSDVGGQHAELWGHSSRPILTSSCAPASTGTWKTGHSQTGKIDY